MIGDSRQIAIHTAEPLVHDTNPFDIKTAIANLRKCKSPGSYQIVGDLIQAGGEIVEYVIHKRIKKCV
jgi:hypothetical protein